MGSKVGDTSNGVALDLDVGGEHLSDQGSEATKLNNHDFVLG